MNINEAFEILGLDDEASWEEIDTEYKRLRSSMHSDREGGNDKAMAELNVARDKLKRYVNESHTVVPVSAIKDIVLSTNTEIIERQEAKDYSNERFSKVLDITTSRIQERKQFSAVVGGISAAAIFLGKDVFEKVMSTSTAAEAFANEITLFLILIGAISGLYWWFLDNRVKKIELNLSELKANLSEHTFFVDLLHQLMEHELEQPWSKHLLKMRLEERSRENYGLSLSRLVREAGAEEISSLILAKGAENKLIKKTTKVERQRLKEEYELSLPK